MWVKNNHIDSTLSWTTHVNNIIKSYFQALFP